MNSQKDYWNEQYQKLIPGMPIYDQWLDKYQGLLEKTKNTSILDLGCGQGNNSLYLIERGYQVIACDFSEVAISRVKQFLPQAKTMVLNMLDGLPFGSESTHIVIADLSLHYFSWNDTKAIVKDIYRTLIDGGNLLLRVNSNKDFNYGAGQGITIEENYFEVDGNAKRFFDRKQIEELFAGWNLNYINEYEMNRYKLPKVLWEVNVEKVIRK